METLIRPSSMSGSSHRNQFSSRPLIEIHYQDLFPPVLEGLDELPMMRVVSLVAVMVRHGRKLEGQPVIPGMVRYRSLRGLRRPPPATTFEGYRLSKPVHPGLKCLQVSFVLPLLLHPEIDMVFHEWRGNRKVPSPKDKKSVQGLYHLPVRDRHLH